VKPVWQVHALSALMFSHAAICTEGV
jgi:hypothetical protein